MPYITRDKLLNATINYIRETRSDSFTYTIKGSRMTSDEMVDYLEIIITYTHIKYIIDAVKLCKANNLKRKIIIPRVIYAHPTLSMNMYSLLIIKKIMCAVDKKRIKITRDCEEVIERHKRIYEDNIRRESENMYKCKKRYRFPDLKVMFNCMVDQMIIDKSYEEYISFSKSPWAIFVPVLCNVGQMEESRSLENHITSLSSDEVSEYMFDQHNQESNHWIMGIIDVEENKIFILDSMKTNCCQAWGKTIVKNWVNMMNKYIRTGYEENQSLIVDEPEVFTFDTCSPHQRFNVLCGFYAVKYVEMFCSSVSIKEMDDIMCKSDPPESIREYTDFVRDLISCLY